MKVCERIRQIYEERPYPTADERALQDLTWRLPPLEWIGAMRGSRGHFAPERVLVAGCGTGTEAFNISRKFPASEIVAADFSPRSTEVARDLQKRSRRMRNIRFVTADLTSPRWLQSVGRDFDFVSCHGVLSYIPAPALALRNITRGLKPDGVLYLGVNGAEHPSVKLRRVLPRFGLEVARMRNEPYAREILKIYDAVMHMARPFRMARKPLEYIRGDVFGAFILNLPLAQWVRLAHESGFHFLGSYSCCQHFRPIADQALQALLMPRSRAEVCEVLELLRPSSFHYSLFSRKPEAKPPWDKPGELLKWRPATTKLYTSRLPRNRGTRSGLRTVKIKSPAMGTLLEWQMPGWELEILRKSDGKKSLRDILGPRACAAPIEGFCPQLYLLYQLAVLNLLPPGR